MPPVAPPVAICRLSCLAASVNTAKRFEADVAPIFRASGKRSGRHACISLNRYAKSAPQKTKNRPATNRSQSSQRANTFSIRLTRKISVATISPTESPVLFRAIRRSREKAAAKQDKEPTPFGRRLDHNCPRCGQSQASMQGVPVWVYSEQKVSCAF